MSIRRTLARIYQCRSGTFDNQFQLQVAAMDGYRCVALKALSTRSARKKPPRRVGEASCVTVDLNGLIPLGGQVILRVYTPAAVDLRARTPDRMNDLPDCQGCLHRSDKPLCPHSTGPLTRVFDPFKGQLNSDPWSKIGRHNPVALPEARGKR